MSLSLIEATRSNNAKLVSRLLAHGNPNETDADGQTSLHIAADIGSVELAALLVHRRADVNARDKNQWTPIHCAASSLHQSTANLAVIDFLLDCGMATTEVQ
jgi:ankyrin repeat protein